MVMEMFPWLYMYNSVQLYMSALSFNANPRKMLSYLLSMTNYNWFTTANAASTKLIHFGVYEFAGLEPRIGLLEWTTGMDYWNGLLEWTTGMDYWNGPLEWTTGLVDYWTDL